MIPSPFEFVLLTLAAFSVWKLLGDDTILDRPRAQVIKWLGGADSERGTYWGAFLTCPWCAGFWITLATYVGWIALGPGVYDTDDLFMACVSVAAIRAVVGYLGSIFYAVSE